MKAFITRLAVLRIRSIVRKQMQDHGWVQVPGDTALWETPSIIGGNAMSKQQIHESVAAAAMVKDAICNLYSKA
ncbi:hypothetical protein UFOVP861_8 [uncultured Caudovirales phage]|uniref:Uncharacterized protein n=1 Tax=uncultured Caudovirales phage TaxID=2100421 RepID=A0A6J5P6R9_9CAUD|nr:hypothetical protein UFOVP861_8 [uncultured Caudovirales phage]